MFLSNLTEDRGERHNYAEEQPEIVARLTKRHEDWLKSVAEE